MYELIRLVKNFTANQNRGFHDLDRFLFWAFFCYFPRAVFLKNGEKLLEAVEKHGRGHIEQLAPVIKAQASLGQLQAKCSFIIQFTSCADPFPPCKSRDLYYYVILRNHFKNGHWIFFLKWALGAKYLSKRESR